MRISSGERAGESPISTISRQGEHVRKLETISISKHVVGPPQNCPVTERVSTLVEEGQATRRLSKLSIRAK
jgi:hypothetical protein